MRILPGPLWKKLVRFGTRGFIERDRKYLEILDRISQIGFHRQKNHVGLFVPLVTLATGVFGLVQRTVNADYAKTFRVILKLNYASAVLPQCLSPSLLACLASLAQNSLWIQMASIHHQYFETVSQIISV